MHGSTRDELVSTGMVFAALERNALSLSDYLDIVAIDSDEPLVPVPETRFLTSAQDNPKVAAMVGPIVYVREGVASRLVIAGETLAQRQPRWKLRVHSGYRSLKYQRRRFAEVLEQQRPKMPGLSESELQATVHQIIAFPDVADHPAGAAVDLRFITQDGGPVDIGVPPDDEDEWNYVFNPFVTPAQWAVRQLLREVMLTAGFAPYDLETDHFSYGGKEWARYMNLRHAIYPQVEFRPPGL